MTGHASTSRVQAALEQAVMSAASIHEEDIFTTMKTGPLVAFQIPAKEWTELVQAIRDLEPRDA